MKRFAAILKTERNEREEMTNHIKIYDVYNKNIIKNSYCGTITANCGCTTGCGCFYVITKDKEIRNGKIEK